MVVPMDQRAPRKSWSVQDAKNRFSEIISAAQQGPQTVTKHGREAVVIVASGEYARLKRVEQSKKMTFTEMLLAIPKAPPDEDPNEELFPRMKVKFRDVEL
jgi:antitoxin Phd